jgi:hypothetical protein
MMNEISEILGSDVIERAYDDVASPNFRSLGDWGTCVVKALRLATCPIDLVAFSHDKLATFINRSLAKVPKEDLEKPQMEIIGPIIEGIKYQNESSILYEMFSELLTSSINKNRLGDVHPAFPGIIKQLSPDEAIILFFLKRRKYQSEITMDLDNESHKFVNRKTTFDEFPINKLNYPYNMDAYMQHLDSLDLVQHVKMNEEAIYSENEFEQSVVATGAFYVSPARLQTGIRIFAERSLTAFGTMFAKVCVPANFAKFDA